jgi:hypothetical protein
MIWIPFLFFEWTWWEQEFWLTIKNYVSLPFQKKNRTVHCYISSLGNIGKSVMVKHTVLNHPNTILIPYSNRLDSCLSYFAKQLEKNPVGRFDVAILDVPKSANWNRFNFGIVEKFLDSCFSYKKYEGGKCTFNPLHFFIFGNGAFSEKDLAPLSSDHRWNFVPLRSLRYYKNIYKYKPMFKYYPLHNLFHQYPRVYILRVGIMFKLVVIPLRNFSLFFLLLLAFNSFLPH